MQFQTRTIKKTFISSSETEEVKKEETTAVVKPEGKKPEFVLKIKTQTVSDLLSESLVQMREMYILTDWFELFNTICWTL